MLPWADAVEEFMIRCRSENLTPKTLHWYESFLRRWGQELAELDRFDVASVQAGDLRKVLLKWQAQMKPVSINSYLRALKAFLRFLKKEGVIERDPSSAVGLLKTPKEAPPTFSLDAVRRMLGTFKRSTFLGQRNLLIIGMCQVEWDRSSRKLVS